MARKEASAKVEATKSTIVATMVSDSLAGTKDGIIYEVDPTTHKCKKVLKNIIKDLDDMAVENIENLNLKPYQQYLKDHFDGEEVKLKNNKLYFRGYRISCNIEDGFIIEDMTKHCEIVDSEMEGVPTPEELGEFFRRPARTFTPEEMTEAIKRGKELAQKVEKEEVVEEEIEYDNEDERKKALKLIRKVQDGKATCTIDDFRNLIHFKKWVRKCNALIKQWQNKEIRYPKFLSLLYEVTENQSFVVEEKNHRSDFKGACLPEFSYVDRLLGDKLEVDGKLIEAVPFLMDYLLHYEPKAMQQLMRYANGEVSKVELLQNPYYSDWKITYNKRALENTAENAQLLTALFESVGLIAPQDLLYKADLKVEDKILIMIDGEWKKRQIMDTSEGICLSKQIGITKLDKWIKIE